jgi:hypothetical protein
MNDMRPHHQPGLPVMPDADDVMEAIRRLELTGPRESDDLGPSVEAGVSGRTASAGGPLTSPLVSPPLRDLGLLLDDALIDNLLMVEGPQVSIPVEMALEALAQPERGGETALGAGDTLGARWRLRSWSDTEPGRVRRELSDTLVPPPPAFLTDWPIRPRTRRAPSLFPWNLLGDSLPAIRERSDHDAVEPDLSATAAGTMAPGDDACADPSPAAGARWTSAGVDPEHDPAGSAEDTARTEMSRDRRERTAARALAEARRSPSAATVALASLVFPGWGQALNEERGKAAAFRFAYLATLFVAATLAWRSPIGRLAASLASFDPVPVFGWLGVAFTTGAALWLLSVYDAFVVRLARLR